MERGYIVMNKKKNLQYEKIPQYLLIIAFMVFCICTGYFSLKNYWNIKVSGVEATPDGYTKENAFEENFNILLWNKDKYVEYYGLAANWMKQPKLNNTIKLKNGYLSEEREAYSDEILKKNADDLRRTKEYLEEKGSGLLYVQSPYKISKYDSQMPMGIEDYSNDNMDRFLNFIHENGIDTIDLRESFWKEGMDLYDYFFKTDHHWTPEAGFFAFTQIAAYTEKVLETEIDGLVTNIDNYKIENFEDWHLGSNGQRTGIRYGGIDDFHLITPDFHTSITNVLTGETGSYQDVLIERVVLEEESRAVYDICYGNSMSGFFHNPNAANDKTVVLVSDSMGKVVAPFVILAFENVYTTGYDLNQEKIEEINPDLVIYLPYHDNIDGEGYYSIFK